MDIDEGDLLTTELAPKRRDELQIHNKKLGEISNWIKDAFTKEKSKLGVLFLTGPTGSGKSITVEVLCKEQNIELIDYTPELLHNDFMECEKPDSSQLIRFLIKRHGCLRGGSKKRLLFVTELPDQSYQDADIFREELSDALSHIWHPVIFCLTNDIACWNLNPDRLFTRVFLQKNKIDTIVFNPVANTFMKKALVRASRLLRSSLSEAKLNVIGEEARGDLRVAMNMLQMNSVGQNAERRSGSRIICASKANKEEAFHMIGRILYAKRINPNEPKPTRFAPKRRKSARVPEPTERTDLEHDPTDIITMSSMPSDNLLNFLFENDHVFCSDLSKYRHVVDTFSLCDVITGDWSTKMALPDEYVAQIATRSVMWHNYKGPRPNTLYAVARPVMNELERQINATKNEKNRKLSMIGAKNFSSLTAPYQTIIEDIIDSKKIEPFLARPMEIGWKLGKEQIEERLDKTYSLDFKGRKNPRSIKRNEKSLQKKTTENYEEEEEEEEKFTIEDSSDDSFDDF